MSKTIKVTTVIAGIAFGAGILAFMINNKTKPEQLESLSHATSAQIMMLELTDFTSQVRGFGTLQATDALDVSAEVSAKVIWLHEELSAGNTLVAGTEVLRLDDTDLQLNLAKANADIDRLNASKAQTVLEQKNAKLQLDFSKENAKLAEKEYKRKEKLAKQGNLSTSILEAEQQRLLNNNMDISSKEIQLQLFPARLESLNQDLAKANLVITDIKNSINKTHIVLSDALNSHSNIADVYVEQGSFVGIGSRLFKVQNPEQFEVLADYTQSSLIRLNNKALTASVVLNGEEFNAKFERRSDQLSNNRMVGMVVSLTDIENKSELISGSFAEVILQSMQQNVYQIPRKTLHNGQLYLVDHNDKLVIETADVAFTQGDVAVLKRAPSYTRLIVSPIFPAISGMTMDVSLIEGISK
jgi:multidrug resistance efflux pump